MGSISLITIHKWGSRILKYEQTSIRLFVVEIRGWFSLARAEGMVVDVVKQREYVDEENQIYDDFYYPVIRFTAEDGRTRTVEVSEKEARHRITNPATRSRSCMTGNIRWMRASNRLGRS